MKKPCGHPSHPEDGNVVRVSGPTAMNGDLVKDHLLNPEWFIGKHCKLAFDTPEGNKEYMWVLVLRVVETELQGVLNNHPVFADVKYGEEFGFMTDEIIDVFIPH